jgi:hypothetical protein
MYITTLCHKTHNNLSIVSLVPNYIIGLKIVSRNTLVSAIIDRSLASVNSKLEKLPPMQNSSMQGTEEVQRQMDININYYYVTVNSFNVHNIRMEDCYNNIPVTSPSFFCPHTT